MAFKSQPSMDDESDVEGDLFGRFKVVTGLYRTPKIYQSELPPLLFYLMGKFLQYRFSIPSLKMQLVNHQLLYVKKLIEDARTEFTDQQVITVDDIRKFLWDWIDLNMLEIEAAVLGLPDIHNTCCVVLTNKNKRGAQEDRWVSFQDTHLLTNHSNSKFRPISMYGVFDGHGGVHTSQFLSIFCPWYVILKVNEFLEFNDPENEGLINIVGGSIKLLNDTYLSNYPVRFYRYRIYSRARL
ncbi:hypothetical protein RF11_00659 [Thelohanellus kitauei]|uniref:PPM-type phosphatase domain-containing protein n=1 Tax=Thelohanellus kitauei TaxID=669202 RepID=A0A0C2NFG3_THEKT|nr:hypothetical protein RF11_00659 [Thelohanellus kitauei]